ncbi:MAG: hypothetical protein KAJ63_04690 [Methyloprofundus sp.]|nr:hypothetical protein [Methyloprofundus sp.]
MTFFVLVSDTWKIHRVSEILHIWHNNNHLQQQTNSHTMRALFKRSKGFEKFFLISLILISSRHALLLLSDNEMMSREII